MRDESILPGLPNEKAWHPPRIAVTLNGSPLRDGERGIVLSSPVSIHEFVDAGPDGFRRNNRQFVNAHPDAHELRSSLLLWDKIHLPEIATPPYTWGAEMDLLRTEGIIHSAEISVTGNWQLADQALEARRLLFRELDRVSPGQWAMGRTVQMGSFAKKELEDGRALLVELNNCLPVPNADTPIEDILNFREHHRDERLRLNYHIDGIYSRINSALDGSHSKASEISELSRSVADYVAKLKKSRVRGVFGNLRSATSIGPVQGGAAALTAYIGGLNVALPLIATGVITSIAAAIGEGLKDPPQTSSPYEYINEYHRGLPWISEE